MGFSIPSEICGSMVFFPSTCIWSFKYLAGLRTWLVLGKWYFKFSTLAVISFKNMVPCVLLICLADNATLAFLPAQNTPCLLIKRQHLPFWPNTPNQPIKHILILLPLHPIYQHVLGEIHVFDAWTPTFHAWTPNYDCSILFKIVQSPLLSRSIHVFLGENPAKAAIFLRVELSRLRLAQPALASRPRTTARPKQRPVRQRWGRAPEAVYRWGGLLPIEVSCFFCLGKCWFYRWLILLN